jgi:hypothetical protein
MVDPNPICACPMPPETVSVGQHFGVGLRAVDLDSDGSPDLLIGARHRKVNGMLKAGKVFSFERPACP